MQLEKLRAELNAGRREILTMETKFKQMEDSVNKKEESEKAMFIQLTSDHSTKVLVFFNKLRLSCDLDE